MSVNTPSSTIDSQNIPGLFLNRLEGSNDFEEIPDFLIHFELKRLEIFEQLFIEDSGDKKDYQIIINECQKLGIALESSCIETTREIGHDKDPSKVGHAAMKRLHRNACIQYLVFMGIVIRDMAQITTAKESNNNFFSHEEKGPHYLELLKCFNTGYSYLVNCISNASEHLSAIRFIINNEKHINDKARGGKIKARKPSKTEKEKIIEILIKLLLEAEEKNKNSRNIDIETYKKKYVSEITEIWEKLQFFKFDSGDLDQIVDNSLRSLGFKEIVSKSVFERKIGLPMSRPPRRSRTTDIESVSCEMWQEGLSSALKEILKYKFNHLEESWVEKINTASPALLKVWLCRTLEVDSIEKVLI